MNYNETWQEEISNLGHEVTRICVCLLRGARNVVAKMYPEVYIAVDKSIVTLNVHVKKEERAQDLYKLCSNDFFYLLACPLRALPGFFFLKI